MHRRDFLRAGGAAILTPTLAGLLAACGKSAAGPTDSANRAPSGSAAGSRTAPRQVKLGFVALTDVASIVMAKELGYFAERDLDVEIVKQASWPATRDNILNGDIDGAHCLYAMPYAVATGIGGSGSRDLKIAMVLSNNGQGITVAKSLDVGYLDPERVKAAFSGRSRTLGMTFPGGTHDLWLRYWLKAAGVDASRLQIIPVPPPQMVANMKVGAVDAYSVGAPWNAVGVDQGIGHIAVNSQDVYSNHPEKALVVNSRFATERKDVLMDVMAAVLEAGHWLDDLANRARTAEAISPASYVNAPAADIVGQLQGTYELGNGEAPRTYTDDLMLFSRGGLVNVPRRSQAVWAMAQYQRLGLLKEAPPYLEIAEDIHLRDLYEEVAAREGVDVPDDDMAPFEVRLDGVTFDPARPEEEVRRP